MLQAPRNKRAGIRVHLIGIGGSGLSAIAQLLLEEGFQVSGSDAQTTPTLEHLRAAGANVFVGHAPEQMHNADIVLASSAIPTDNPEILEANQLGAPVLKRKDFLSALLANRQVIGIAGTHGKTTTTAMIAAVMRRAGITAGFLVGGEAPALGGNASAGASPHFVIEADEYDRMFLGLHPHIAVVTNVEWDHVDYYRTPEEFHAAFHDFVAQVPASGLVISCADDPGAEALRNEPPTGAEWVTYGLTEGATWQASDIGTHTRGLPEFTVVYEGEAVGRCALGIPGLHNVRNALATIAVAHAVGVPLQSVYKNIKKFDGVRRRFEIKGESCGIMVIDDYAHHPTEVRATLEAARQRFPNRTLWAVFQPHTYSRTQAFRTSFAASFADADHVIVTDIYAARERVPFGMSAADLAAQLNHPRARHIGSLHATTTYLQEELRPGDVLITLGAGDVSRVGEEILAYLRAQETR